MVTVLKVKEVCQFSMKFSLRNKGIFFRKKRRKEKNNL